MMDYTQIVLAAQNNKLKDVIIVDVHETGSTFSSYWSDDSKQTQPQLCTRAKSIPFECPTVDFWMKSKEVVRMSYTKTRVSIRDRNNTWRALSRPQQFSHYYVEPLISRNGKNDRTLLGPCHATTEVQNSRGKRQKVVHAASHNYAGFYESDERSEELQRLCLNALPVIRSSTVSPLESQLHQKIADLFETDFCYTTSTGYGSNLLAFPALLRGKSVVILDEKCHNSMFVGAFLCNEAKIRKFGHNDMEQLAFILQEEVKEYENVVVAVEGLYSMDGTIPPLDRLANLKHRHGFTLLADEAHSLQCLGKTGRGCVEHWNDTYPDRELPLSLFDVRTATLSKACGAIGGMVCGAARFQLAAEAQRDQLLANGAEALNPAAIVQTMHVLSQPTRLQRQLKRLRHIVRHVRAELHKVGIYVHGTADTPVLPIHAGRPSLAAKLSYTLRQLGVLATPIATPAVPYWEARVRVSLSADHGDESIDHLVSAIIQGCQIVSIVPSSKLKPTKFCFHDEEPSKREDVEAELSRQRLGKLIQEDSIDSSETSKLSTNVVQAGHSARKQHGLASGAPRWTTGTFSTHTAAERKLAEATGMSDAMTYPDTHLGLMSTIAALCRPVLGYKRHHLFVPTDATPAVMDGLKVASKKGLPRIERYENLATLVQQIRSVAKKRTYITLYLDLNMRKDGDALIVQTLSQLRSLNAGMTILLNDSMHPGNTTQKEIALTAQSFGAEVLIFGSFVESLKLPGAYLAGNDYLLNELRYTSRGYMFSTSQMPFIMGMVAESIDSM